MYRLWAYLKARQIAKRDAAIEREWQRVRPPHARHGDRLDFYRRMSA